MFDLCDLFRLERPAISLWMVMVAMRAMAMKAMRAMRATIRRRDNMDGNKAWRRITWVTWHLTLAFLLFQKTPFIEISPDAHFLKIFPRRSPRNSTSNLGYLKVTTVLDIHLSWNLKIHQSWTWNNVFLTKPRNKRQQQESLSAWRVFQVFWSVFFQFFRAEDTFFEEASAASGLCKCFLLDSHEGRTKLATD